MLARMIFAAVEQIFRGRAERVVGLAERRNLAVAVIVDADMEPDFRHPLGVAHRTGPGAAHLLRSAPAAIDDAKRVDQLAFPIGLAARRVPGERGQRWENRTHVVLLHQGIAERGLDAPQRQQGAALDAEILFDPREQRFVLLQRRLAVDDAPVGHATIDVLPGLLGELRLARELLEHAGVGLHVRHRPVPTRLRNALGKRAGMKMLAPGIEALGFFGLRGKGLSEQRRRRETGLQQRPPRKHLEGIRSVHAAVYGSRDDAGKTIAPGSALIPAK